jgi:hypothetical protein
MVPHLHSPGPGLRPRDHDFYGPGLGVVEASKEMRSRVRGKESKKESRLVEIQVSVHRFTCHPLAHTTASASCIPRCTVLDRERSNALAALLMPPLCPHPVRIPGGFRVWLPGSPGLRYFHGGSLALIIISIRQIASFMLYSYLNAVRALLYSLLA